MNKMNIYNNSFEKKLENGEVFLHFTGNIFGIGCLAIDEVAIKKIISLKQRDENKSFIVLFASLEQAKEYMLPELENPKIYSLLNQYLPGNLTAILTTENTQMMANSINNKIAIRIPTSALLREFIYRNGPILSTSINLSGEPYCNDLAIIEQKYADWFDFGLYNPQEKAEQPIPSTIIEFQMIDNDIQIKCLREGSIPFTEIKDSWTKPLIQFVCIGNICRSPIAEYYVKKRLEEEKLSYATASCGLSDVPRQISEHSKRILERNNMHIGNRISIHVNDNIIRKSLLLLCMSKDIKKHLVRSYPDAKHKIFTFAEYTSNDEEIDDPYGLDQDAYEKVWEKVMRYTEDLILRLKGVGADPCVCPPVG